MGPQTIHKYSANRSQVLLQLSLLFALVCGFGWASARASEPTLDILFVSPSTQDPYVEVITAFESELEALCGNRSDGCSGSYRIETTTVDSVRLDRLNPDRSLVVTLGTDAARWLTGQRWQGRSLYALLPSQGFRDIEQCCITAGASPSAVFLDQPLSRSFGLITRLLPNARRVGVLMSPDTQSLEGELRRTAQLHGLTLVSSVSESSDDVGSALKRLLESADVLLALPDPMVYNNRTIFSVLLSTYRNRIPVVGYSEGIVKAGAVAAVYTTTENIGIELAQLTQQLLTRGMSSLPPPHFPARADIAVNWQVARSLGMTIPPVETIRRELETEQ